MMQYKGTIGLMDYAEGDSECWVWIVDASARLPEILDHKLLVLRCRVMIMYIAGHVTWKSERRDPWGGRT